MFGIEDDESSPPTVKLRAKSCVLQRNVRSQYDLPVSWASQPNPQPNPQPNHAWSCQSPSVKTPITSQRCLGKSSSPDDSYGTGGGYETGAIGRHEPGAMGRCDTIGRCEPGANGLLSQLMDDLDDISNRSVAHQRRRATQMFTSWLFSPVSRLFDSTLSRAPPGPAPHTHVVMRRDTSCSAQGTGLSREEQLARRFTADFTGYEEEEETSEACSSPTSAFKRDEAVRHSVNEGVARCKQASLRRLSDGNIRERN